MGYEHIRNCLACGSSDLFEYLNLGVQPLANDCHKNDEILQQYPLAAKVCTKCWHSQLSVAVEPDELFKNYLYVSGTTETLRRYFESFADLVEKRSARDRLSVLDIASNDGSLLKIFKSRGHTVLGVDPAENLRALSEKNGVPTLVNYWDEATAHSLSAKFDVVVAMNVLGHVANPLDFLSNCKRVLNNDGRMYIQTSQAFMVKNGEFDTMYHEHHSFFTCSSFGALAERVGLEIVDIERVPVHGTSYLVELKARQAEQLNKLTNFDIYKEEVSFKFYELSTYEQFSQKAHGARDAITKIVKSFKDDGYSVVGYGVAAKAMTFINFSGIDIDYFVDDNPMKVGLLTPGSNRPIYSPDRLRTEASKTLFLVLAWNFREEIVHRIKSIKSNDLDRYLVYFPEVNLFS